MKKLLLILGMFVMLFTINAQGAVTEVVDPTAYLSPTQKAQYKADLKVAEFEAKAETQIKELESKIETYGEWVGVGGEVGIAVREGLMAVVDVADKFGGTKVGEFTILMVGWKVMGKDVVKIILGLLFILSYILIMTPLFWRLVTSKKILVKDNGWFKYPKEYKIVEPSVDGNEAVWLTIAFIAGMFLSIWITYYVMF